ncbi:aldehyde ferredoxin oxidoreductase C-terminal domain-containing protein [Halobacterium sp. R2-5]|uniref:aldehyde ferredoxin oxidoreductase family protein n=1 Tax=Halobacterium sp. R2-5 TaxID=2715751 RepID=UPI00141D9333|nr:aldehyde ferredoxin oxidoreductase C-terminal domain-containing protein [Halobacterium sp. R2-5]NIB99129.1 aldehyde ferredoxin oxidoreductase [Halobacterium sp. R2-5]
MVGDHVLRVRLGDGAVSREEIRREWRERYVGGKGLAARYLLADTDAGVDPLGPGNVLAFAVGPLTGRAPGEPRFAVVTKSPLTDAFLDSYAGGDFAARLAGSLDDCLLVLIEGERDEPGVLVVEDGTAHIEDAPELAGMDAAETAAEYPDSAVACVGPAGEHGVRFATVATDGGDHHAGRGGAGAVMGAKGLKAVVARGDPPETPPELADAAEEFADAEVGRWQAASETLESVDFADEVGALPTRGWQSGTFDGADDVGIEAVREASVGRERPDEAVPGGFRVPDGDGETVPRGAASISLGAGLGIGDFDAVAELGGLCDRLGVDVISAGSAVAFAARASERGDLDRNVDFGDPEGARRLIREVATRETDLGDALADGVVAAADRLGFEQLIPAVKAMELPTYDPRAAPAMALAYATSDRGACHRRARPIEDAAVAAESWSDADRVRAVVDEQNSRSARWCLVADDFAGEAAPERGARWLRAAGVDATAESLAVLGERVWNLTRLFNVREGHDRRADALPEAMTVPLPDGPAEGAAVDRERFEGMLDAYYDARGWNGDGIPTEETLQRLDLTEATQ